MSSAKSGPQKIPVMCRECHGTGRIEYALDQTDPSAGLGTYDCPKCKGYGVLTP